jgi:hypothetical protein
LPRKDESSAEAVKTWIEEQGYEVEHRTAEVFRQHQIRARQGLTYRDPLSEDRAKVREVDVVGSFEWGGPVEIHIVVECKRSRRGWFTRTATEVSKGSLAWLPVASGSVRDYVKEQRHVLRSLTLPTGGQPFEVIESHWTRQDLPNGGHSALRQVVEAATGLRFSSQQFPRPAFFHPLIVLDGLLYRATFDDEQTSVVESGFERVHWSGAHHLDAPVVVDIVTLANLGSYLATIRNELRDIAEYFHRTPGNYYPDPTTMTGLF